MAGTTYGYARVSTRDQNLDRQLAALEGFGVQEQLIFADKSSGKDFERPAWCQLVRTLGPGDVLAVKSIDRLGRNYDEILCQWRRITREVGASIVVLDMPLLDTRETCGNLTGTLIADIVLQLLSYVAEMERDEIRQRQAEGIAAAHARGVKFGRPRKEKPAEWGEVRARYREGRVTRAEAAAKLGVCVSTFDRWMKAEKVHL